MRGQVIKRFETLSTLHSVKHKYIVLRAEQGNNYMGNGELAYYGIAKSSGRNAAKIYKFPYLQK